MIKPVILVTGAAVVERLREQDWPVRVLVH